jgi:hypothetical protein
MDLIDRKGAIAAVYEGYGGLLDFTTDGKTIAYSLEEILSGLPSAEPSIPISWIKKKIDWLASLDNAFASLAANNLDVMVKQYEEEREFNTDTEE